MKKLIAFLFSVFICYSVLAQDTVRIETVKVDTVKVENVRVDTVMVAPVQPLQTVQMETAQPAPENKKKPLLNPGKMYFGGYANMSFGKYTAIGIEPLIGYKLTPKLSLGGKISYEYIKDKRYSTEYETSNYGASVFGRFRLTQRIYAHAEFSEMNYKLFDIEGNSDRKWVPFLFLGGGFSQPISKNTWFTAEVLFDVLQNENSPYKRAEPFFSVGFGVGF